MQRRHLLSCIGRPIFRSRNVFGARRQAPASWSCPSRPGAPPTSRPAACKSRWPASSSSPWCSTTGAAPGAPSAWPKWRARPADGLTIGVATLSTHGVNPAVYSKLPYHPTKDFMGVTEIVKAPGVIVVNPAVLPVKDFAELVKYLKANPGKVSYATPGNGTIGHMWGELFKSSTGTSMVHIPYRGAGPAVNDVLAGQVAVYFDQVASSLPHVKSGKLKALAVSWPERLDVLPEVPTYAELGYKQANEPSWFGLVAPAATPRGGGRPHPAGRGPGPEGACRARAPGRPGPVPLGHHTQGVHGPDRQRDRQDETRGGLRQDRARLTLIPPGPCSAGTRPAAGMVQTMQPSLLRP